jgi:hypothetical protein
MGTFYNTLTGAAGSKLRGLYSRFVVPTLSQGATYGFMGIAILVLDIFTSRFLQFPILFVVPVALSAWFCRARVAYGIAFLLPLGRLGVATFLESRRMDLVRGVIVAPVQDQYESWHVSGSGRENHQASKGRRTSLLNEVLSGLDC